MIIFKTGLSTAHNSTTHGPSNALQKSEKTKVVDSLGRMMWSISGIS